MPGFDGNPRKIKNSSNTIPRSIRPAFNIKTALPFIIIASLGLVIYSSSLFGDFCSDDFNVIVDNAAARNPLDLTYLWQAFNTRFLVGVSFALNYYLGGLHTFGYHAANLLFHLLAAGLVYYFARLIFKTPFLAGTMPAEKAQSLALFSSLIFLTHPIQTQGVSYITQRAVAMAAVFYLLTLIFYTKSRLEGKKSYYIGALVTALLGMFTKEMTATLPLMLTVYELYFFGGWRREGLKRIKMLVPFYLAVVLMAALFLQDRTDSTLRLKDQILYHRFNWNYFLTEVNVLRTYLRLLFFPFGQHHEYKYPIAQSFFEWPTLWSFCLVAGVVIFGAVMFKKSRLVSFSIAWFFIAILLEVVHPCFVNKGVLYEHWLYVAMVGFALFLPAVFDRWIEGLRFRKILMLSLILIFSLLTFERNKVWRSDIALWQDNIRKEPQNPIGYFGLGAALGRSGGHPEEILFYQKAVSLDPYYYEAFNNMAVIYLKRGEINKAMEYCRRALLINSDYPESLATLGACYLLKGEDRQAKGYLQKAVELYDTRGIVYKSRHAKNILALIP